MTIPSDSYYPTDYDTDENLYLVHDSLRMTLAEDYTPGDTSITVSGDAAVMAKFPPKGIVTLTEQCSEPELRAVSLYYSSRTDTTFDELELMPGFTDYSKLKNYTHVTQNVYADHHNRLKDACIAIEEFVGVKGTYDTEPYGDTITGRLHFLRRLVLSPRAWFTANKVIGVVPLTVTFHDDSLRNPTSWIWDFGDGSTPSSGSLISTASSISTVSSSSSTPTPTLTPIVSGAVPCGSIIPATDAQRTVSHTYFTPGKYDVTLQVGNKFGRDSVTMPFMINARATAPDEATIAISPSKIAANQIVTLEITDNGEQVTDPVVEYTWKLGDDLPHGSSTEAIALYSIGGIYDVKVRADTELGAYRITTVEDAINVVEATNLWLFAFDTAKTTYAVTKNLRTYEFGLTSESWKSEVMPEIAVTRDYTFTSGYPEESYQRDTFLRNNGVAQRGVTSSGNGGQAILYWAEDSTTIRYQQAEPFGEVWSAAPWVTQTRNWNWFTFADGTNIYIMMGLSAVSGTPATTDLTEVRNNMATAASASHIYNITEFGNGAEELENLPDSAPATYRTCFKDGHGFVARNDAGPGGFFRIRSFYRTSGDITDYAQTILKLPDIPGNARTELRLVPLANGIFVFNNSGEVAAYNPTTNVWTSGGAGVGSASFRTVQDVTVTGYAETSQPLLAASDEDRRAYLSYDYSANAFIKFNEADLTFSSLDARPTSNEQFMIMVF